MCMAGQTFVYQTFPLLSFLFIAFLPFEALDASESHISVGALVCAELNVFFSS